MIFNTTMGNGMSHLEAYEKLGHLSFMAFQANNMIKLAERLKEERIIAGRYAGDEDITLEELAKLINEKGFNITYLGLYAVLFNGGYWETDKTNGKWLPTLYSVKKGLMLTETKVDTGRYFKVEVRPKITPAGVEYFLNKYANSDSNLDIMASIYLSANAVAMYNARSGIFEKGRIQNRVVYYIHVDDFNLIVETRDFMRKENLPELRVALNEHGYVTQCKKGFMAFYADKLENSIL